MMLRSLILNRVMIGLAVYLLTHSVGFAQTGAENIKINQEGYFQAFPKIAVVTAGEPAKDFYVIKASYLHDTVFSGKLSSVMQSKNSSTRTQIADFSGKCFEFGSYYIYVPGVGSSYNFTISNKPLKEIAAASLKAFYYQRSSIPLLKKYAGKWARGAGHPDDKVIVHPSAASVKRPAGTVIATPGGWYDAGDYNKYIVNSGITMATLLSAYEDFPSSISKVYTNIPESRTGLPDIMNEILYNLRWMLTMQDPEDGGVYNKCTNASFDGMVMPGVTKAPRYVVQKSTAATLDFVAVMAQASRILSIYPDYGPGLEQTCMKAAIKGWKWAIKNPAVEYDQNLMNTSYEPKITTGGYGDRNFSDEWFWAASEMFINTWEMNYYEIISKYANAKLSVPSWGNVYSLGVYSLLRYSKKLPEYPVTGAVAKSYFTNKLPGFIGLITDTLKGRVIRFADQLIAKVPSNAFQTVMGQSPRDFTWGSNSTCANQGVLLLNAYWMTDDQKYIEGALSNMDYLLGRNATGYCFVTGFGAKSPMNPHHRPSVADGITEPIPGFLVGGPNPGRQDGCKYVFTEPETAYLDVNQAYASNEIAINWNAPLVYLTNMLEALCEKRICVDNSSKLSDDKETPKPQEPASRAEKTNEFINIMLTTIISRLF